MSDNKMMACKADTLCGCFLSTGKAVILLKQILWLYFCDLSPLTF